MGFSLGSFLGGAADAGTASIKSAKIKREEERSKVEDMIFSTSARLFENGKIAEDLRTSEIKANKQYMTKLLSMAPSLKGDQARQAFILGLDKEGREDIITMVNSDAFIQDKATKGLAAYMDASDDPVEFKDPVTLGERVQGVVTERPMDKSAYYGVSTTKDKEVDKIVDSYTSSFSVAYGMSAARAQGLLDAAKQEVRVQGFTIDWAHKKLRGAQEDARVAALVATATLGTENAKQNIVNSLINKGTNKLKLARTSYIQSSGLTEKLFDIDSGNQAKYLKSNAYKTATKEIIESAVMRMEEHTSLRETTEMFLRESFPGKWGGRVGGKNTVEKLKPDVYYLGNFGNGLAVGTGAEIQAAKARAATGTKGLSAGDIITAEKDSTYMKGEVAESKKVDVANITSIRKKLKEHEATDTIANSESIDFSRVDFNTETRKLSAQLNSSILESIFTDAELAAVVDRVTEASRITGKPTLRMELLKKELTKAGVSSIDLSRVANYIKNNPVDTDDEYVEDGGMFPAAFVEKRSK